MSKSYCVCIVVVALIALPVIADAAARLVSVTPVSGGCVSGPTGPAVQAWDVEAGQTYTLRIEDVLECGNGGTDPTIHVRVMSAYTGNTEVAATNVGVGIYEFDYTMSTNAICTFPIKYCITPGDGSSGIFVIRDDGVSFQAHLRSAMFGPGCTNPMELCPIPTEDKSWGSIKALFE